MRRRLVTLALGLSLAGVLVAASIATAAPDSKRASQADRLERTVDQAKRSEAQGFPFPVPGISPPGANDFDCRPSRRRPHPVVLVHGTFGDMTVSWNLISPELVDAGYCVFALDYGNRATERIQDSAEELKDFVSRVRRATDADEVQLVGHSQGGMMPRWYIKFLGGDRRVEDLVGLSPSNHGTTNPLAPPAGVFGCRACAQQAEGSDFIRRLNRGDETPGPIDYTQIQTRFDEVVTPFRSAFLDRGGRGTFDHDSFTAAERERRTNVLLQKRCPGDASEHLSIIYDRNALQWVKKALARSGPADPDFQPDCVTPF